MAEKTTGTPGGDSRPRQDSTVLPGEYPGKLPFGISVPTSTGAPGSSGSPANSSDPTIENLPSSVFGAPNPMTTGSPGTSQPAPNQQGGVSAIDMFAFQSPYVDAQITNGSSETEAAANKVGHPGPFNTANPLDTGVGEGQPLIGGRGGKNRGR